MLTSTQQAQLRLYLGYPDNYRWKNVRLESVMSNLSPDAETQIGTFLTNLATIETKLLGPGLTAAGVKRLDEIWFENGGSVGRELRKLGRRYVSCLSVILGVPIYSDVFGPNGYLGDSFFPGNAGDGGFFNLG